MKNALSVLVLMIFLLFTGCNSDDTIIEPEVPNSSVTFAETDTIVAAGSEFSLKPHFNNDYAANKKYKWYSSDETIAGIESHSGIIKGRKVGSVIIKIESIDKTTTASCSITVGLGYNNQIFYMKEEEGIVQIFSKLYESDELIRITYSSSNNTELNLVESNKLTYVRNNTPFYQEIGIFIEYTVNPLNKISCWGDSMTAGAGGAGTSYPKVLASLTGLEVSGNGVGGQTSTQIAARQGGVPLTISIDKNQIPISGGVSVIDKSVNILYNGGKFSGSTTGYLSGVKGKITTDDVGNWTFTRIITGAAVSISQNSTFSIDNGDKDNQIVVLWYGRNNYSDTETVLNDIQASINHLKSLNKKYLVLSVCNGNYPTEKKGLSGYNKIIELNQKLQKKYSNNYLDIRKIIVNSYDPNNAEDIQNYKDDMPPSTILSDKVHFNAKDYTIVANSVYAKMKELGWVS